MISVKSISALGTYSSFILISWEIEDTTEPLSNYEFSVYESVAYNGDYTLVEDGITTLSYKYKNNFDRVNSEIHTYFKVECCNVLTEETSLSDVVTSVLMTPRDNYADAIIYQHNYFLNNILKRPKVKLLVKKRSGTRCSSCWDPDTYEVTKSSCTSCYSTGFSGGYESPILIPISFTEPGFVNKIDIYDIKDVQSNITPAWASNYPLILPGDIIVDSTNRRFIVLQSQPTTKDGNIYLRQVLQLQMIPVTDIVYQIPVEAT